MVNELRKMIPRNTYLCGWVCCQRTKIRSTIWLGTSWYTSNWYSSTTSQYSLVHPSCIYNSWIFGEYIDQTRFIGFWMIFRLVMRSYSTSMHSLSGGPRSALIMDNCSTHQNEVFQSDIYFKHIFFTNLFSLCNGFVNYTEYYFDIFLLILRILILLSCRFIC